jgi:hypothetical protein
VPYIASVYAMPGDKTVYLAYRKPPQTGDPALRQALDEVEKVLVGIIDDVLQAAGRRLVDRSINTVTN